MKALILTGLLWISVTTAVYFITEPAIVRKFNQTGERAFVSTLRFVVFQLV